MISWVTSLFFVFNVLNEKKQHLLLLWMKITNQMPNYETIGLTSKKNQEFWRKENEFFVKFLKFFNIFLFFNCFLFNLPHFLVNFDVSIYLFVFINLLHVLHDSYYIKNMFSIFYLLNYIFLNLVAFFLKKFTYIAQRATKLKRKKQINNRKLSRLIYKFNFVYLEMINMNEYFSKFLGFNLICYFLLVVVSSFAVLFTDIR